MRTLSSLMVAGALALLPRLAVAADIPEAPVIEEPIVEAGGWYLRGGIGMSNQSVDSLYNYLYETVSSVNTVSKDFDSAPIFQFGIGYQYNDWLRFDITGEYRGGASFSGLDIVDGGAYDDNYTAIKREWVGLANVYFDLGTWYGVTPYVGAGAGFSYNNIDGFTDVSIANSSVAYGSSEWEANFAWALYAGLGYQVTQSLTVDLGYRYISLGDAHSGNLIAYDGTDLYDNPMEFKDLTSHDVMLSVRYRFGDNGYAEEPLIRKY